jgi:TolA-binding protein
LAKGRLKSPSKTETEIKPTAIRFATPASKAKNPNSGVEVPKATMGLTVAAGLEKTAQSGLREPKKAAVKTEKGTAKKETEVDPMILVVQQLAKTLGNLDTQMKLMHSSIEELQGQAKKEATRTKESATVTEPNMEQQGRNLVGPFYAVARGQEGHQGIYQS